MMRGMTGTFLWACLAAVIGIGLFVVKHEVKDQEARLAELNREIQRNQEEVHVLKAEWSYLNDPARLRRLAETHLGMKPTRPGQIARLDEIPDDGRPIAVALAQIAGDTPAAPSTPTVRPNHPPAQPVRTPKPVATVAALDKPVASRPAQATPVGQAKARPSPVALAQAGAPSASRTIVIHSPAALAAGELASSGEAR